MRKNALPRISTTASLKLRRTIERKHSGSLRFFVPSEEDNTPRTFQLLTTEIFCTPCPNLQVVQETLRSLQCFLQRTIQPHRKQITKQYHFEGSYGVAVIFLAGSDASRDVTGQTPISHEARFWITGNSHPRSRDLRQQICQRLAEVTKGKVIEAAHPLLSRGA